MILSKILKKQSQKQQLVEKHLKTAAQTFRRLCNQHKSLFDPEESAAWPLFQKAFQGVLAEVTKKFTEDILEGKKVKSAEIDHEKASDEMKRVAKEYAKLDGYNVMLRSLESFRQNQKLDEAKCWTAPVRVYARNNEWESGNGKIKGSHGAEGQIRPEYVASIDLYDEKEKLVEGLLDPDCIEARDWNLSAGQYKPFTFKAIKSEKSVAEMIRDLKEQEMKIVEGLDRLMAMVGGQE